MIIIQIIIWIMTLTLSVIPGIFLGSMVVAMLGPWAYWPGYAAGTILFLTFMSPILFLNKNIPVQPHYHNRRHFPSPFFIRLLTGKRSVKK